MKEVLVLLVAIAIFAVYGLLFAAIMQLFAIRKYMQQIAERLAPQVVLPTECPQCGSDWMQRLKGNRFECQKCKHVWAI